MTLILFFYVVPALLSMLQIGVMLGSTNKLPHYRFLQEIYKIQDYFWRRRHIHTFESFLLMYMVAVIVLPGINWISIVLASTADMTGLYLRLKSAARSARFEVFGREDFNGEQVCYTMPMEKHPNRIRLAEDFE